MKTREHTALWSSPFLRGLPQDSEAAIRVILDALRSDYRLEGEPAPGLDPGLITALRGRLPRRCAPRRIPELVVYDLVMAPSTPHLTPYSTPWKPLAQRAIEERLMLRVSDCYELFLDGSGLFRIADQVGVPQGMVLDFERVVHLLELTPLKMAKRMLMDLLGGTCGCTHRVTPGQRASAWKKCRRDHVLGRWRTRGTWRNHTLWRFLDQAALGFSWNGEGKRHVPFANGAFHSGMLACLLDCFVTKANVVQRWCPRCHESLSVPCKLSDCLLAEKPLDALPLRGRPDWLVLRPSGKCCVCGGILTEDELGRPCPGRPSGGGEEPSPCGSRDFELAQEWLQELSLWKCAVCSDHFHHDRFFLAQRCVVACPPDVQHDRCPGVRQDEQGAEERCQTAHARAAGFRLCYWLFYVPPGLSPDTLPPPKQNRRLLGKPGERDDDPEDVGGAEDEEEDSEESSQGGASTTEAGIASHVRAPEVAALFPGHGVEPTTHSAEDDRSALSATKSRITEEEGQAILAAALAKAAGEFRGYRRSVCQILARDLRDESPAIRRRAVRFLFAATSKGDAPACHPSDADYRYLHRELARRARRSHAADVPEAPAALRIAWNERGHGALVAAWVKWHLDAIVVRLVLDQCAQDQTGWRRAALERLVAKPYQARALFTTGPRTPRQRSAAEAAFVWLHRSLSKDPRRLDLPATAAELQGAWDRDLALLIRETLSHYNTAEGAPSAGANSPAGPGPGGTETS